MNFCATSTAKRATNEGSYFSAADFTASGYAFGDVVHVRFGSFESDMPFFDGYYTNPGGIMLRGLAPEKNIAVCINYGDLSAETGIATGDTVEITMAENTEKNEINVTIQGTLDINSKD